MQTAIFEQTKTTRICCHIATNMTTSVPRKDKARQVNEQVNKKGNWKLEADGQEWKELPSFGTQIQWHRVAMLRLELLIKGLERPTC